MNRFADPQETDDALAQSARDLLDRRGAGAIDWLNERIFELETSGEMRALDVTYRMLSLVERHLRQANPR